MKLTHHLDWNYSQPFITKTLLLSFALALSFHVLFLLLFNIQDLLPKKEKVHPFVKVEAKIPKEALEGVAIEMNHKYAKLLPKHPLRSLKDSIPEVRRPSFFPKAGRLITTDIPKGSIDIEKPKKLITIRTSEQAEKIIQVKESSAITLEDDTYRSVRVLIDTRSGKLIALNSKDVNLVNALEKELTISKSSLAPFEEDIVLTFYD